MIKEVIQALGDDKVQAELLPLIEQSLREVSEILPDFPNEVSIYFFEQGSEHIIKEFGVGGYSYSKDILSLGWDLKFHDRQEQQRQLRSTIFHEGLHLAQGYTGESKKRPILHCAVYEGLATIFEREYANVTQPYGDYAEVDVSKLQFWMNRLEELGDDYSLDDYQDWAFRDRQSEERWRLYRVGTWIVDQILKRNTNLALLDLIEKTPAEIVNILK